MPGTDINSAEILGRVAGLRRRRPDGSIESWEDAGTRWGGIDRSTFSHWDRKAREEPEFLPALPTLAKIAETEGVSLDWLVYGPERDPEPSAYVLIERLAEDIGGTLNRTLSLLPDRKTVKLVRQETPTGKKRRPGKE